MFSRSHPRFSTLIRTAALVLLSAGLSCNEEPAAPEENLPPNAPSEPSPASGSVAPTESVELSWRASDPENDAMVFDIYLGTAADPPLVEQSYTRTSYTVDMLPSGQTFYWRVAARDAGGETKGPVWTFQVTTAVPSAPNPPDQAERVDRALALSWQSTHPTGGGLVWDVYLGEDSNPPLFMSDWNQTTLDVDSLERDATYYWRVVARDDDMNESSGPVWSFSTDWLCPEPGLIQRVWGVAPWGRGEDGEHPREHYLDRPMDVAFDPQGNIVVCDWNNHRVLTLDANGLVKTLIGTGERAGDDEDGAATAIALDHPTDVTFAPGGDLILTSWHRSVLKRMPAGSNVITTFAGTGERGFAGDGGAASAAAFDRPVSTAVDDFGRMFVGDQGNMVVRMIDTDGTISTVVGTPLVPGYAGNGGPANQCELNFTDGLTADPSGRLCFDPDGNLYIADTWNDVIRRVDASGLASGTATITRYAGVGPTDTPCSDPAATCEFLTKPSDVVCDGLGNLYIADTGNDRVLKVTPAGEVSTVAGGGTLNIAFNECCPATDIEILSPAAVEIGPDGDLYIADFRSIIYRVYL